MDLRLQGLRVADRVQAQPRGQRGELVRDRGGLLGGDPVHQVIVGGVGVGELGGQLRLADPAHPVHRLHRHRRPAGQRPRQRRQVLAAAGEIRVPRRDLPHPAAARRGTAARAASPGPPRETTAPPPAWPGQ